VEKGFMFDSLLQGPNPNVVGIIPHSKQQLYVSLQLSIMNNVSKELYSFNLLNYFNAILCHFLIKSYFVHLSSYKKWFNLFSICNHELKIGTRN
jgi:hypothetical protein